MKIPKVINPIEARHISALLKFRAVVGGKKTPHLLAGRLLRQWRRFRAYTLEA